MGPLVTDRASGECLSWTVPNAWDLVGELHGGWQLDLDGSNQGLLEVDAPLWLVGGEGDLLDLPGFHLSLHRRLQEHLESLRDWRGGGGHQCPPVERFGSTQLLVEVVELDVPESDLEDTVAGTLGGEALTLQQHLTLN